MKKQMIVMLCFLCMIMSVTAITGKQTVCAASKTQLKQKIEDEADGKVSKMYYDDFDYDGQKEAFALIEISEDMSALWYASDSQIKKLSDSILTSGSIQGICKVTSNKKVFVIEGSAGGWGGWSYCYYIQNGRVIQIKKAGEGLKHIKGNLFAIYPSDFDSMHSRRSVGSNIWDWTGHTWKKYYVKLIGNTFINVKSHQISQKNVASYTNGKKYLAQIKKAGYRIGKIYYRENKVINVNVSKKVDADNTAYENVNFDIKGKKLKLQINNKKGKNIVEKSSFNGVYKRKAYIRQAS